MAIRVTRAGVGLIIGIIVLAGLVWGGLYIVKQRGETARRDETLKIAEQKLTDESNKDVALNQADKDKTNSSNSSSSNSSEDKTNSTSSSSDSNSNGNSASSSDLPSTGPSQSVTELPQTGAADILAIIPIAAITFAAGSYVASRKALR